MAKNAFLLNAFQELREVRPQLRDVLAITGTNQKVKVLDLDDNKEYKGTALYLYEKTSSKVLSKEVLNINLKHGIIKIGSDK